MITNEERDSAGRHPGAPAWDGDLTSSSPSALEKHDKGLTTHIGNLTVLFGVVDSPAWRVRTPEERRADGFEKWVARLVAVRNERDRRERQIGGLNEYLRLVGSPEWEQPWSDKIMSGAEANYVAGLAVRWARTDPMEQWVNAAPEGGRTPLDETISEYLGSHNPFPDESAVEVLNQEGSTWEQAVIVERVGVDEWTVEYADGEQAWRDHHELRPVPVETAA
jgi:hypothetical protein